MLGGSSVPCYTFTIETHTCIMMLYTKISIYRSVNFVIAVRSTKLVMSVKFTFNIFVRIKRLSAIFEWAIDGLERKA